MAEKYIKGTGTGKGGWRGGGRPKGSRTDKTERINLAVTPEEKTAIKEFLNNYRNKKQN